ncbi:MAG: hypothetical protein LBK73_09350 [Treponema sp.]|jgi:hypothetical protein|nr:hypothetical protein [Treponema sp.]
MRVADTATAIQNTAIQPPQVAILSPADGGVSGAGTVVLRVHVNAGTQFIKSVRILVNGQVVGGDELRDASGSKSITSSSAGLRLATNESQLEFRVPISLQPGENRIEALAGNGYSEGRALARVTYTGTVSTKPNVYILAVGVSAYDDSSIPSLKYSSRDAQGVVNAFKAQEGRRYGRVNALSLAKESPLAPTAENIRDSLSFLEGGGGRVKRPYRAFYLRPRGERRAGAVLFPAARRGVSG